MSEPVFFVPDLPPPGPFTLGGDEGRHAADVRRIRPGEALELADGRGRWAAATVTTAARGALTLHVGPASTDPPPRPRVVLIQALPKGERSELAVDLATQAGVDEIVPWQAARCVARWTGTADAARDRAERGREKWQRTAREAAKQARRHTIPEVRALVDTAGAAAIAATADRAIVLHEGATRPLAASPMPADGCVVLIVGPEGGLAPEELVRFEAAGAHPVRLGREVLRASTAAAVALGALGVLTGRWR